MDANEGEWEKKKQTTKNALYARRLMDYFFIFPC